MTGEAASVDRRSTAAEEEEEWCGIAGAKPRVERSRVRNEHSINSSVVVLAVKDFIGISLFDAAAG